MMIKIGPPSMSRTFAPPANDYQKAANQKKNSERGISEEYFSVDWREGREIRKLVLTQRLYQISPNSTQA